MRCKKGTRRKKGECVPYVKSKAVRCSKGYRRIHGECTPKSLVSQSSRCPRGTRKRKGGPCISYVRKETPFITQYETKLDRF